MLMCFTKFCSKSVWNTCEQVELGEVNESSGMMGEVVAAGRDATEMNHQSFSHDVSHFNK